MRAVPLLLALPLLLAGCVAVAPDGVDAASNAPPEGAAPPVEPTLVSHDGNLAPAALACGPVACRRFVAVPEERIFETDAQGVVDVALTLTWDGRASEVEQLVLGVFTCHPDACESDADLSQVESVTGPSGITFEWGAFAVPAGERLYVFVQQPPVLSGTATVSVTPPRGFHVEGTFTPVA